MKDKSFNVDNKILETTGKIVAATHELVQSTKAAQHELVGQDCARPIHELTVWSQGIMRASKLVLDTTHTLSEFANAVIQGLVCEEHLVSAAKQVLISIDSAFHYKFYSFVGHSISCAVDLCMQSGAI